MTDPTPERITEDEERLSARKPPATYRQDDLWAVVEHLPDGSCHFKHESVHIAREYAIHAWTGNWESEAWVAAEAEGRVSCVRVSIVDKDADPDHHTLAPQLRANLDAANARGVGLSERNQQIEAEVERLRTGISSIIEMLESDLFINEHSAGMARRRLRHLIGSDA